MEAKKREALRVAIGRVNSVKSDLIRAYDALASAGCDREAETLRNVCRSLEDRQISWRRRMDR